MTIRLVVFVLDSIVCATKIVAPFALPAVCRWAIACLDRIDR